MAQRLDWGELGALEEKLGSITAPPFFQIDTHLRASEPSAHQEPSYVLGMIEMLQLAVIVVYVFQGGQCCRYRRDYPIP